METHPVGDEPPQTTGPRPQAHAGQNPFPSNDSDHSSPSSEATEATAKQAKTKAALSMVPILGQGPVSGHPGGGSPQADLDWKGWAAGSLLLWLLSLLL